MKKSTPFVALCLSAALTLPLAAHAELSGQQMDAAKLDLLSGKMFNVFNDCPKVELPKNIVKTQDEFDRLNIQLKRAQLCAIAARNMAASPAVEDAVQKKYPNANKAQVGELTDIALMVATPLLAKMDATVVDADNKANDLAEPFMHGRAFEDEMQTGYRLCAAMQPKEEDWASWVAADIFLSKYVSFDQCVKSLFRQVEQLDAATMVNKHHAKDPSVVKTYMLEHIAKTRALMLTKLSDLLTNAAPSHTLAQQFSTMDRARDIAEREAAEK